MKRFYRRAAVVPAGGGHGVTLDGRLVKTPGKNDLVLASLALAKAVAEEWEAQLGEIRRAAMPLTRLAEVTIDRSAVEREAVVRQVAHYAGPTSYATAQPIRRRLPPASRGFGSR